MKIRIYKNTLDEFTQGRNNLNLILENQRASCDKDGLGYEPKNNIKNFSKICLSNSKI